MPKSVRKFIRREKARIRSQFLDVKEQESKIKQIYQKFSKTKNKNKLIKKPAESPSDNQAGKKGKKPKATKI